MDHGAMVDQAAATVLAHHEILMASPASGKLNSFYPNPSESECSIAQAVCNSGQLFIQANSKQIGGSSDFMISTPNIMDCPQLLLSFTVPAIPVIPLVNNLDERTNTYMGTSHDGWGFDAIERLEVSFANSNISNLQIQGHAMRDWSLLQCKNADERKQMLKIAGKGHTWSRDKEVEMQACIPLSFLFFRTAGGVKGGFGIDGRVLNGPITFQFHFRPIQYFCSPVASIYRRSAFSAPYDTAIDTPVAVVAPGAGAEYPSSTNWGTIPTAFTQLELTMRTYQLMDGTFSVSKALEANPSLIYSIPSLWMNTYSQDVILDSTGKGTLNINSVPAGMIQAMILRIRPVNVTSAVAYDVVNIAETLTDTIQTGGINSMMNYEPSGVAGNVRPFSSTPAAPANEKQTGITAAYRPYVPWSLPLKDLNLQYSGQNIYNAKTAQSHDGFTRSIFNDDLRTDVCGLPLTQSVVGQERISAGILTNANANANTQSFFPQVYNLGDSAMVNHETQSIVIPLMHDGNSIFRHRAFENLPHYSGSTLQLEFHVEKNNTYNTDGTDRRLCYESGRQYQQYPNNIYAKNQAQDYFAASNLWRTESTPSKCASFLSNRLQRPALCPGPYPAVSPTAALDGNPDMNHERILFNANPDTTTSAALGGPAGSVSYGSSGGTVKVDITYVVASLFQVTNGVAELQL